MTDDEKVQQLQNAFHRKVDNVNSMANWENLITNVDTAMVKSFLSTNLGNTATALRTSADSQDDLADDIDDLVTEINAF